MAYCVFLLQFLHGEIVHGKELYNMVYKNLIHLTNNELWVAQLEITKKVNFHPIQHLISTDESEENFPPLLTLSTSWIHQQPLLCLLSYHCKTIPAYISGANFHTCARELFLFVLFGTLLCHCFSLPHYLLLSLLDYSHEQVSMSLFSFITVKPHFPINSAAKVSKRVLILGFAHERAPFVLS